jgi:hypothetical protein
MSMRSALAGAVTTAVLIGALGSPAVADIARDADSEVFAGTVTAFADWEVDAGTSGDVVAGIALRLGLGLVLATVLCAVAGRSRSRAAAFLGGWGALVVAAGLAAAASHAYTVAVPLDGRSGPGTYLDGLTAAVDSGAAFALWTGWLVGAAVALTTRPARATARARAATRGGVAEPTRRATEPPPPWWAPTPVGDGVAIRPGPTVFPPGGLRHAAGFTYEMSTRSGDPHPSDPDATRPVGMPTADGADGADTTIQSPRLTD